MHYEEHNPQILKRLDSSIGIAAGYGLGCRVSRQELRIQWVTLSLFRSVKLPRFEADHSVPSSAPVDKDGAISTLVYISSPSCPS
jgi:hypothetical protein